MGFFSTLGSKISSSAHSLGQKARSTVKKVGRLSKDELTELVLS